MKNSKIEWTHHTFNPWMGCTKVSPACDNCYASVSTPARIKGIIWGAEDMTKMHGEDCEERHRIDWVIVGGESGHSARPMHPDWARRLRDQCQAAGVPFFFKQHGEWLATDFCNDETAMITSKRTIYVRPDGTFHGDAAVADIDAGERETAWVGKKTAGRLLDGREWNEVPE